ncbi:hypothetical protein BELL_0845g00010 [Botrytis elliptica]|uniref:Uncharacterized protein n=1 Tax=Botrytis elliptica TaxID=278938 RepID=A0A4Z1J9B8_9HELO|nr:hypothetical protein EAE99_009414 [Botrytis elliptica]TGO68130.1 hypothetical protein BELL_0845g00010 [Botrytis elliptica]
MAISKQQEAVIAKIVSYNPATWFLACESEFLNIPEKDRVEFGRILIEAMDVYKSKVQNVIPILKRGPNLNPEVNISAWAMMHARFLARLFIKHPTLCERLCVKLSNETYNPGWKSHVRKFRDIEDHKNEIEEQIEAACRESQLFFSTHSGYNFVITNHSVSSRDSQSKVQSYPRFEAQSRQTAAQSLLALSQSDEAPRRYESTSSSRLPPPQIAPLQVNGGHDQATTSNSKSHTGEKHPKHVRFALALEKSAAAELGAISRINLNSLYRTPQEKAHQLQLERDLQAQIASQNDDLYGVSDDERDRPTSSTKLSNEKRVAISSNTRRTSAPKPAVITDSDTEEEIQLTASNNDSKARANDTRQRVDSKQCLSSKNQESTSNKATTPNRSPGIEDHLENESSSPAESVDGDNDERFSLREMIDAMEFVAEHPWICDHLLVDHVWDEYKLFHEYNTEALKVAEEEIGDANRAAAKEATPSAHKGTEAGSSITSAHRTRSTSQTSSSPSVPSSRLISPPLSTPSVFQAGSTDEADANNKTAAEEQQAITAASKAKFVNRNFQLQVATVYRALGVVPTVTGPIPSNHPPLNLVQSSESFAPTENALPHQGRSPASDRFASDHNLPTRSQLSMGQYKATNPIVDENTIIVDTSSLVPAHVYSVPDHIAPPRRGRSSEELVPAYAPPKRRSQSTVGQASVYYGNDANHSTSSDRAKKSLAPTMNRAQMREKLQVAAVYQSLGRQNARSSGNFGNDGARVEMEEEVQKVFPAIHTHKSERTRRGQDDGLHKGPHGRHIPSFGLQANVPEIFAQNRSLSPHGGVGAPSGFGLNPFVSQNMDFGTGLASRSRTATIAGQDGEGFAVNQTHNEQEMGFAGVDLSGIENRTSNHQIPEMYGVSQPIAALDNPQEDFWINCGSFGDFGPIGIGLNMDVNMNLDADLFPAPDFNDVHGSGTHLAGFRGDYNLDLNDQDMPFPGPRRSSRHLGDFNPDANSSGFGGMKQPFDSANQNIDDMDQAPADFEGMDEFMFHNTPLAQINAGLGFGDMNQTSDQSGRMDPVDVPERPRRERAGTRSQPGEAVVPVTPNRTRASTRSQRRYDLSARGANYFRFQDTGSVEGDDGNDYIDEGDEEEVDDEDGFEGVSPSKRARHRKDSSRGSARSPAKGSAKGTPRKSRKTPVKKGPKVAFNPRPASSPSTLDRGPPRRYHQTTINLSPGALGPRLNLEISGRQRRLPFTTVAQDRAQLKKEFEMDPEDQDL